MREGLRANCIFRGLICCVLLAAPLLSAADDFNEDLFLFKLRVVDHYQLGLWELLSKNGLLSNTEVRQSAYRSIESYLSDVIRSERNTPTTFCPT